MRGILIQSRIEYLQEHFGERGLADVREALQPSHQRLLAAPVAIAAWYPLELSEDILECAERILGSGDGSLCRGIGVASCRRGYAAVYRYVAEFHDDDMLEILKRHSEALWESYFDSSALQVTRAGTHQAVWTLRGVSLRSRWQCHLLDGFIATAIELAGGADVEVRHAECTARGDLVCRWDGSWRSAAAASGSPPRRPRGPSGIR